MAGSPEFSFSKNLAPTLGQGFFHRPSSGAILPAEVELRGHGSLDLSQVRQTEKRNKLPIAPFIPSEKKSSPIRNIRKTGVGRTAEIGSAERKRCGPPACVKLPASRVPLLENIRKTGARYPTFCKEISKIADRGGVQG